MDERAASQLKKWLDEYHVNETPAILIKTNRVISAVGETGKCDRPLSNELLSFHFEYRINCRTVLYLLFIARFFLAGIKQGKYRKCFLG